MAVYSGKVSRGIIKRLYFCVYSSVAITSVALAAAPTATPQRVERNVFIPMRDGVRLATDLYLPADLGLQKSPVVLIRTPYGKDARYYEAHDDASSINRRGLVGLLTRHGYYVAVQDVRGRFNSEGEYVPSGGDAEDGYDTIDWLSKQSWSNGRIGAIGCSYEGDEQIFMAGTKHPALKAIIPEASGSSVGSLGGNYRYFGVRVGGASEWAGGIGWFGQNGEKVFPRLSANLPREQYNATSDLWSRSRQSAPIDLRKAWNHLPMKDALSSQGMPSTDFEDTLFRAPADPYWKSLPYMTDGFVSDVPALFINSWYDFGADMTMVEFEHFRRNSLSSVARSSQYAIMSPHAHCAFSRESAENTRVGERDLGDTRFDYLGAYVTWFDAWLKEDEVAMRSVQAWPRIRYYAMGRNRWQRASDWPIPSSRELLLYLASNGSANSLNGNGLLSRESTGRLSAASDSYIYDPANPVPSRGGAMCCTGTPDAQPGAVDQRSVEARSDVLVYTSRPLEKNTEVTGTVHVVLYVSSDALDTDYTAKLVDVDPDGRAFNILESILRSRYRMGQEREVWMRRGKIYQVAISLGATSNVFLAGHRIRLEISSSNFPRFDRNMNLGGNNAAQTTWAVARNIVYHTGRLRSRLVLPVISAPRD
jgi:uncharacterized protein